MWKDVRAKYRVIERFKNKYPIWKMCELFEVSRSGFYKWRKRTLSPQLHNELDQIIIECQALVKQTYGYHRVWLWMKQNKSVECHPLTVLHHMRKLDLLAQIRRRRPYTLYKQGGHRYENLLNRQFVQSQVNYRWVTDITYIITPLRTYYLCAIMDLWADTLLHIGWVQK